MERPVPLHNTSNVHTVQGTAETIVLQSHNNQVNKYCKQNRRQNATLSYT